MLMSHRRRTGAVRRLRTLVLSVAALLLVASCATRQMEPARKVIADIEAAVAAAGTEPSKYTPDALKDVNDQLAALKVRFEQKDYAGVVAAAPVTLTAARGLPAVAARRKAELQAMLREKWIVLAKAVPKQIEAVREKVEGLANRTSLPEGVTRTMIDSARKGVDDARALWERAARENAAERPEQAVTLANQARDRASGVSTTLGEAAPAAVK
jgi:hypothetical protein